MKQYKRLAKGVWSALAVAAVALLPAAVTPAAQAAELSPWVGSNGEACFGEAYISVDSGGQPGVSVLNVATGEVTRTLRMDHGFNAVGYNPGDGHLYGTFRIGYSATTPQNINQNGTIWRIDSNGSYAPVKLSGADVRPASSGNASAGALPNRNWVSGDFDEFGDYWISDRDDTAPNSATRLYQMRLEADGSMTQAKRIDFPARSPSFADFSSIPGTGKLWALSQASAGNPSKLFTIDTTTGQIRDLGAVSGLGDTTFYGLFYDSQRNLFAVGSSAEGNIWAINSGLAFDPDGSPTGVPLEGKKYSSIKQDFPSGDAAQCGALSTPYLTFAKSVDKPEAALGDELAYSVTVTNTSFYPVTGAKVIDRLPRGVEFISASDGGVLRDGLVEWTLPRIDPGQHVELRVKTRVTDEATGDLVNRVQAENPPETPPNVLVPIPTPESACEDTPEASCAITRILDSSLSFKKSTETQTAAPGDEVEFTITATNTGEVELRDVTVADILPSGVSFASADANGSHKDGIVTWQLASLPVGDTATFRIRVTVEPGTQNTQLVNAAQVTTRTPLTEEANVQAPCHSDPTQSCASVSVPTQVDPPTVAPPAVQPPTVTTSTPPTPEETSGNATSLATTGSTGILLGALALSVIFLTLGTGAFLVRRATPQK